MILNDLAKCISFHKVYGKRVKVFFKGEEAFKVEFDLLVAFQATCNANILSTFLNCNKVDN